MDHGKYHSSRNRLLKFVWCTSWSLDPTLHAFRRFRPLFTCRFLFPPSVMWSFLVTVDFSFMKRARWCHSCFTFQDQNTLYMNEEEAGQKCAFGLAWFLILSIDLCDDYTEIFINELVQGNDLWGIEPGNVYSFVAAFNTLDIGIWSKTIICLRKLWLFSDITYKRRDICNPLCP